MGSLADISFVVTAGRMAGFSPAMDPAAHHKMILIRAKIRARWIAASGAAMTILVRRKSIYDCPIHKGA
jgi:hypothetical protein